MTQRLAAGGAAGLASLGLGAGSSRVAVTQRLAAGGAAGLTSLRIGTSSLLPAVTQRLTLGLAADGAGLGLGAGSRLPLVGNHRYPEAGRATLIDDDDELFARHIGIVAADLKASGHRQAPPSVEGGVQRQARGIQLLTHAIHGFVGIAINAHILRLCIVGRVEEALLAVDGIQRTVDDGKMLVGGIYRNSGKAAAVDKGATVDILHISGNVKGLQTRRISKGIVTDTLQRVRQTDGCDIGSLRKGVIRHQRDALLDNDGRIHRHIALPVVHDIIQIGDAVRLAVMPCGIVKAVTADMHQRIGNLNIRQRLAVHKGGVHDIGDAVGDIHLGHIIAREDIASQLRHSIAQLQFFDLTVGKGVRLQRDGRILECHRFQIGVHKGTLAHACKSGRQRHAFQPGVAERRIGDTGQTAADLQGFQLPTVSESVLAQHRQTVGQNHRRHRSIGESHRIDPFDPLAQIQCGDIRIAECRIPHIIQRIRQSKRIQTAAVEGQIFDLLQCIG